MRKKRPDTRHGERVKVRLKVGDTVEVLSGKDRGERGQITEVLPDEGRVRVSGLAIQTVHQRPGGRSRAMQQQAGRIQMPGKIHISNLMLICASCAQRTRPQMVSGDGGRQRVCRECGAVMPRVGVEE